MCIVNVTLAAKGQGTNQVSTQPPAVVIRGVAEKVTPVFKQRGNLSAPDDLFPVSALNEQGEYAYGYIDRTGRIVVKPQYLRAWSFSDGCGAIIATVTGDFQYVTQNGQLLKASTPYEGYYFERIVLATSDEVIRPRFEEVHSFADGLAPVWRQGKWGYMNHQGKVVIEPQYDTALYFSEERAAVKAAGKWGYIDKQGNFLIEPRFDFALSFSDGLAEVRVGDEWGYIDQKGILVIQPQYFWTDWFSEGLAAVMTTKGKWQYISKSGAVVFELDCDCAWSFSEGLAPVQINRKVGYVNRTGSIALRPLYDVGYPFQQGIAPVFQDGDLKYIDKEGKSVWKPSR
jgi:hypothetical protein